MKMNDVGDAAVTCVSLYISIICAYVVNTKDVPWDEHLIYHWKTILRFTSFDNSDKTFRANHRNMLT